MDSWIILCPFLIAPGCWSPVSTAVLEVVFHTCSCDVFREPSGLSGLYQCFLITVSYPFIVGKCWQHIPCRKPKHPLLLVNFQCFSNNPISVGQKTYRRTAVSGAIWKPQVQPWERDCSLPGLWWIWSFQISEMRTSTRQKWIMWIMWISQQNKWI